MRSPLHSVASHDASTQLPFTECFIGCIFSNDPFNCQALSSAHCNAGSASPPQPADSAPLCIPSSSSHASGGHVHITATHVLLQPPPGLEEYACQHASHGILVKAAPVRPRLCTAISVTPPQPLNRTTHVETHPVRSATTCKRSASNVIAGTHNPVGADPRAGSGLFPKPRALCSLVKFGQSKSDGQGYIGTAHRGLMHHQYRLSVLQWNPDLARRNLLTSSRLLVESSMRLLFKKPVIMFRASPISSLRALATRTLLSFSTKTPLSLTLWSWHTRKTPQVKVRGVWSFSSFEASCVAILFREHLLLHFVQYTFTLSWPKKRDASTELLQRLHGFLKEHNVDFIGGDIKMSALSTVGDVFSDPEFSAPSNSFLWRLGALEEPNRECIGFFIMP